MHTPVGIYLRLRDRFRDTILLESSDNAKADNSFSFIGVNAIGGIEITNDKSIEWKYPGEKPENTPITAPLKVPEIIWQYMQRYELNSAGIAEERYAQGVFGYCSYDAIRFFETVPGQPLQTDSNAIPLIRYRLYQYVIAINHFNDELFICENELKGITSEGPLVEALIKSKDVPVFPFKVTSAESTNITDEGYIDMVKKGIASCYRGDVFQIVLSRRFSQQFRGDEFNVYRALRSINPSPYLFFFDYGDYKLMGSSPESQLIVHNGEAIVHPIAGTFKRTGNDAEDALETERLFNDAKENAEHVMLVDLARNDLSRVCTGVKVNYYRHAKYFSHVIHLVSEVSGKVAEGANPFTLLAKTFPAGTLSGAPKIKAMQLINNYEPAGRGFYAGTIGFIGFNGSCNQAIMIRSFLSKKNTLYYQAGAGVVAASKPESELQEVNNKLGALKKAIEMAANI